MRMLTKKLDQILEKKLRDAVDAGLDDAIRQFQSYIVLWRRQPIFTKVITGTYPNFRGKIVVKDFRVAPGKIERWHAVDEGLATAVNGIDQIAKGRRNPMIFPQPYEPTSFYTSGAGGGRGRIGTDGRYMKIGPRFIQARNWTKAVKSKKSRIKAAMKAKIK